MFLGENVDGWVVLTDAVRIFAEVRSGGLVPALLVRCPDAVDGVLRVDVRCVWNFAAFEKGTPL